MTIALVAAISLTLASFGTPVQARGNDVAKVAAGAILLCLLAGCGNNNNRARANNNNNNRSRAATPSDGAVLEQAERILIQTSLQREGVYGGTIDGDFGPGTRASIKAWQTKIGAKVTGYLTGAQANTLLAMSPRYDGLPPGDPMWFEADVAADADAAEVRRIQEMLAKLGFDVGTPDGKAGKKTFAAIAAYKARYSLPGDPLATKRLLAHMDGVPFGATPAAVALAAAAPSVMDDAEEGTPDSPDYQPAAVAAEGALAPVVPEPKVAPASVVAYELAGMRLGMIEADLFETMAANIGADPVEAFGVAADFGGTAPLTSGQLLTAPDWPAVGSEQVLALYDEALPENGAVAILRSVMVGDGLTPAKFDSDITPGMVETYGAESRVKDKTTWIGGHDAFEAVAKDPAQIAACGSLGLSTINVTAAAAEAKLEGGAGPQVDTTQLAALTRKCGDVLNVTLKDGRLDFVLWNSDFILERLGGDAGTVPAIKF